MKRQLLVYASLLVFFLIRDSCIAQENYLVSYLTEEERANFGNVYSLYEDPVGIIWMGVYGKGLAYYDGEKVKRFPLPNEQDFASRDIVFEGFEGKLYLNDGDGIRIFDPIVQDDPKTITLNSEQVQLGSFSGIAVTKNEEDIYIWGALQLNAQGANPEYHLLISKNHGPFQQLTTNPIRTQGSVLIKRVGETIFAKAETDFEIWSVDGKVSTIAIPQVPASIITTFNFQVEEDGTVWLGGACKQNLAFKEGQYVNSCTLWKKSPDSNQFTLTKEVISTGRGTISSTVDTNNYLQRITIINERYFSFADTRNLDEALDNPIQIINTSENFLTKHPFTILKTKSGIIWWGSIDGLHKLTPQPPAFKLLPSLGLRSFIEDTEGYVYGSVDLYNKYEQGSSINRYDPDTDEVVSLAKKNLAGGYWYHVNSYKDKMHAGNGIVNPVEGYTKRFDDVELDFNLGPYLSLITTKGELWKAHWGVPYIGVYAPDTGKRIKRIPIEALQSAVVSLNDWYQRPSDGTIWLGTYGVGIFVFDEDGTLLHHLDRKDEGAISLPNNVVSAFYEDSQGRMWIGHGSGLSRIDPDFSDSTHYTFDPDNPESRLVYGILPEEDDRFLWLSTSTGIFRFDSETGQFMDFPLHPNVMNYEYNRASYYKSKKGQFFFGTDRTDRPTISFFPEDVLRYYNQVSSEKSKIILTSYAQYHGEEEKVILQKKGIQNMDSIVLQPGDRFFELSFLVTDFRSTESNSYSYYLENYEEDWNPIARNNNRVRYENLSPGTYTLKMRGGLVPETTSQNQRDITVIVKPYWYQTVWAKIGGVLFMLGFGFLIYKFNLNRQYEKQETKRLKEVDDLKTRLYTNITHEFRTPLTVIMGMNDTIKGFDKERNLIQRNAKNLLRLVNQLLDLSKLDSGTLKMDIIQGDIILYLKYLTESFYSMASDKKVNLSFHSEVKTLTMDYDEIKLQHVIYNLLSNAIKFTRPGGKVNLTLKTIQYDQEPYLEIIVKDTGIGIGAEELPHIFERFYQADNIEDTQRATKTFGGTGIGLALTKELIELMKGQIRVESEKSWGSRFIVRLPIENITFEREVDETLTAIFTENKFQTEIDEINSAADHTTSEKPLLLLVEDNSGVVEYVRAILNASYEINVAINGQEGIEMAMERIPDIVITDIMMPEKNGYEVCDFLKNDNRTSHIPIVILTAKADLSSKLEGLGTGADVYLSKPFEKEELLIQLKNLLTTREKLQTYYSGTAAAPQEATPVVKREHIFIEKVRSYVLDHIQDSDLSVNTLSEIMELSHIQLYRKLKALTGQTPSQFIRLLRLKKAVLMLETTDLNISEIAYEVGFNDPNYFTRMFKQEYGKVPGAIRDS